MGRTPLRGVRLACPYRYVTAYWYNQENEESNMENDEENEEENTVNNDIFDDKENDEENDINNDTFYDAEREESTEDEGEEVRIVEDETEEEDMIHDIYDIPKYDPPKKKERIEYWKENQWMKATITSEIRGYGGDWYNVIHEDGNVRGSIRLHRDSL